ncbi:DNA-processing protein DprA [Chryseolinea sp. H1M3-3]|uniref:DNA-processing protein DprA n=1 Tax=Chryseolinea sp. H1M3-3 TaxID=3034144 RepID=UPI0023ED326F|nr:DNA-processing protein DprA [Chryseolinea sp. H1M3-3]
MKDAAYWIALSHLPRWGSQKINNLIIKFYHNSGISIEEFFNLPKGIWEKQYELEAKDVKDLVNAKLEVPNYAFLAESLISQGFEMIPITSKVYSQTLKNNLKTSFAPPLLYIKGNTKLLHENSVAIVGSRDASEIALKFADVIAKKSTESYKVIVSGFAKGVDRQALDSAIKYKGQSIIVLPQGIQTFTSGYKEYYRQIVNGDVLVLSTFFPKSPWKTALAMARNPIIYGLANDIYVAESSEKGGTWEGVHDGLKKGRKIFVRMPQPGEKNANKLLIASGAIPIDDVGNVIYVAPKSVSGSSKITVVNEPSDTFDETIRNLVRSKPMTASEILEKLKLDYSVRKLSTQLKKMDFLETKKIKNKIHYKVKINSSVQPTLF